MNHIPSPFVRYVIKCHWNFVMLCRIRLLFRVWLLFLLSIKEWLFDYWCENCCVIWRSIALCLLLVPRHWYVAAFVQYGWDTEWPFMLCWNYSPGHPISLYFLLGDAVQISLTLYHFRSDWDATSFDLCVTAPLLCSYCYSTLGCVPIGEPLALFFRPDVLCVVQGWKIALKSVGF